jgi:nicotinamidase-related amidase
VSPASPSAPIEPGRTALLLMDFQAGIVERLAEPAPLLERVAGARQACRDAGVTVGHVRVAFSPAARDAVPDRNKAFAALAGGDRMADGAPDTEIVAVLAPEPDDVVVTKVRVGAFSTTDLGAQLAARGIDTLVLAGIATSGVVLSTVRDAADHDYRLVVLADGCADMDPEVHRLLVERVFPRQADIITTSELRGLLPAAAPGA